MSHQLPAGFIEFKVRIITEGVNNVSSRSCRGLRLLTQPPAVTRPDGRVMNGQWTGAREGGQSDLSNTDQRRTDVAEGLVFELDILTAGLDYTT
jgi:hypothetical protein